MRTLQAVQMGCFKDGGTKRVLAEDGREYFIDYRISSQKAGKEGGVYDKHPNLKGAKKLSIKIELIPFKGNEVNFYRARTEFLKKSTHH